MAAKKRTVKKKKATAKKNPRTARQVFDDSLRSLEKQLGPTAARRVRELRNNVRSLERQVDRARADAEKRLRNAETQIRKDAVKMLRRLEHLIEPPKPKRTTAKRKKATTRKKA